MTNEHPITPPPELVQQLANAAGYSITPDWFSDALEKAFQFGAQWGADQELEACRMEIIDGAGRVYIDETSDRVRLADDIWSTRRPKLPSLKEQLLQKLDRISNIADKYQDTQDAIADLRRDLEDLPND